MFHYNNKQQPFRLLITLVLLLGVIESYSQLCNVDVVKAYHYEVDYNGFIVDFDTSQCIPYFSFYHIIQEELLSDVSRSGFFADYTVPNTPLPSDYTNSGFDRGHMCPVASCISENQKLDCMSMVNIAPQLPSFNRGFWKKLEVFERNNSNPEAYVISGCTLVYNGDTIRLNDKVAIPYYFYKIVYNPSKGVIAFLTDHEGLEHSTVKEAVIPLDELEVILGIDFFPDLNLITKTKLSKWEF